MGTVSVRRSVDRMRDRVPSLGPLGQRGSEHIHVHTTVNTLSTA